MELIRTPWNMQDTSRGHLLRTKSIGVVPTMGALHEGHMSLIRTSRMENDITVATIFVNPSQFGPGEDFERYPRDSEGDIAKLRQAGVDVLFMPEPASIYPEGFSTWVEPGEIASRLCGAFRPGHFRGVATVVAKLLNITMPTRAYFGQKDYQQSLVIRNLARDLNIPSEIVVCPIYREPDGLAMSSRNAYLTPGERAAAPAIFKTLSEAAKALERKEISPAEAARMMEERLSAVSEVQYAGVYSQKTLEPLEEFRGQALIAAACVIGTTRLIDNVTVG